MQVFNTDGTLATIEKYTNTGGYWTPIAGTQQFAYTNGKLMSESIDNVLQKQYYYDERNRLYAVLQGDTAEVYHYDMFGRNIQKQYGSIYEYLPEKQLNYYFENEDIAAEIDGKRNILREITHADGVDEPLWSRANNTTSFYMNDMLGSITGITDSNGFFVEKRKYRAFGEMFEREISNGGGLGAGMQGYYGETDYGFTGRNLNSVSGLMDYRTRQYMPQTGMFTQYDNREINSMYENIGGNNFEQMTISAPKIRTSGIFELTDPMGFDSFGYVGQSPLNAVDPLGEARIRIEYWKPGGTNIGEPFKTQTRLSPSIGEGVIDISIVFRSVGTVYKRINCDIDEPNVISKECFWRMFNDVRRDKGKITKYYYNGHGQEPDSKYGYFKFFKVNLGLKLSEMTDTTILYDEIRFADGSKKGGENIKSLFDDNPIIDLDACYAAAYGRTDFYMNYIGLYSFTQNVRGACYAFYGLLESKRPIITGWTGPYVTNWGRGFGDSQKIPVRMEGKEEGED